MPTKIVPRAHRATSARPTPPKSADEKAPVRLVMNWAADCWRLPPMTNAVAWSTTASAVPDRKSTLHRPGQGDPGRPAEDRGSGFQTDLYVQGPEDHLHRRKSQRHSIRAARSAKPLGGHPAAQSHCRRAALLLCAPAPLDPPVACFLLFHSPVIPDSPAAPHGPNEPLPPLLFARFFRTKRIVYATLYGKSTPGW